ncbi:alpha/beta fold hydrolase [Pseudomonas sp. CVAP|uniref:thioesterase II family protein n=1 Tax=Pseudomonas sp. CVAP\|nr:alpha/beta fold hydrolase [Pseudomonas sp. CVAP\
MANEPLSLLCFSYAGGSAGFYSRWRRLLPYIKVIPIDIPGRGRALDIPALVTRDSLIDYLLSHYAKLCVPPFALFGHSLGARIAFEFQWALEQVLGLKAARLFVSGCLAPERFARAMSIREQDLSDETLLRVLEDLGGTPPELMSNPGLMEAALPMIRADFLLAIDLSTSRGTLIDAPINLLLGSRDKVTNLFEDYPGWMRHTTQQCQVSVIEGDHFFIRSQTALVVSLVGEKLKEFALNVD